MKINIQTVKFDSDIKLEKYVTEKLNKKLKPYEEHITSVDVYLKLDSLQQTIKDKIAEIEIHIPKNNFFAKHSSKSFEDSFDEALDSVLVQIKRKKDKWTS